VQGCAAANVGMSAIMAAWQIVLFLTLYHTPRRFAHTRDTIQKIENITILFKLENPLNIY